MDASAIIHVSVKRHSRIGKADAALSQSAVLAWGASVENAQPASANVAPPPGIGTVNDRAPDWCLDAFISTTCEARQRQHST
jgi:hypothetical protein